MNRKLILIGTTVAVVLAFVAGVVAFNSHSNREAAQVARANNDALVRPHAPVFGNPAAKVTIVEFFDYNCPYCRTNMADVQRLIADDPKLRVVFREWPVFGEGSMFAAKAALASLQQGKYWPFHEALMTMKGRAEEATVLRAARQAGLDVDRLRVDMEKREILDQIYETMDLADTMMLTGTPTFIAGHEASFGKLNLADLKQLVATARKDMA